MFCEHLHLTFLLSLQLYTYVAGKATKEVVHAPSYILVDPKSVPNFMIYCLCEFPVASFKVSNFQFISWPVLEMQISVCIHAPQRKEPVGSVPPAPPSGWALTSFMNEFYHPWQHWHLNLLQEEASMRVTRYCLLATSYPVMLTGKKAYLPFYFFVTIMQKRPFLNYSVQFG